MTLRALAAKIRRKPLALCDGGDVDGIASAALFKRTHPEGVVVLAAPTDIKKPWVKLLTWDFVADLPCPNRAKVRADHHKTNKPCAEIEFYDPEAPAAALLAAKALGLEKDPVARELVEAAIQTDTTDIRDENIRLLDLAVRHATTREKLIAVDMLAEMGLKAVEKEPLRTMARRGLERGQLVKKIAEATPIGETLFIYSPT
ncbi:MAG: Fis family transcriptional regulator, partial [Pyrobaculum sp.]